MAKKVNGDLAIAARNLTRSHFVKWVLEPSAVKPAGGHFDRRGDFTFYAPITTCIIASVIVSLILWLMSR